MAVSQPRPSTSPAAAASAPPISGPSDAAPWFSTRLTTSSSSTATTAPRWTRSPRRQASRSPSSTTASPRRTSSSPPCSIARRSGSWSRPARRSLTGGGTADDPEGTLIRGFTVFLRGVAESPEHLPRRLPRRGRRQRRRRRPDRCAASTEQAAAASQIAADLGRALLGSLRPTTPEAICRASRPQSIVGLSQVGARTLFERLRALDAGDARREARPHGLGRPRRHLTSARPL